MTTDNTDLIVLGVRREVARIEEIPPHAPEDDPTRPTREEELAVLRVLERGTADMAALLAEREEEPVNPRMRLTRNIARLLAEQVHFGHADRDEVLARTDERMRPLVLEQIEELEFVQRLRSGEEGER